MKIIDKNGKELIVGARVQTGTTASTKKFQGTITGTETYRGGVGIWVGILYDNEAYTNYTCWETLTGIFQCEEVELIDDVA